MSSLTLREYEAKQVWLSVEDENYLRLAGHISFDIGPRLADGSLVISPKQHVGIVRMPTGATIVCEPKLPVRNLFQMLAKAYGIDQSFHEEVAQLDRMEDLIEFVIVQFAAMVERRIQIGLYRTYLEHDENLTALRGRINFNEQVRQNLVLKHRIHCRYTEFSHDVPENQIIRQVIHRLSRWVTHAELRNRLAEIDAYLGDITPTELPVSALDQMHYHRLNDDYRPIHQLCRLFLEGASVNERIGSFDFNSFLIDMNNLFERFVFRVLADHRPGWGEVLEQVNRAIVQDATFTARLDLLLRHYGADTVIADTKYKRVDTAKDADQGDVFQIIAYCVTQSVNRGVLIYPRHLAPFVFQGAVKGVPMNLHVLIVDLGVPFEKFDAMCGDVAERCWMLARHEAIAV